MHLSIWDTLWWVWPHDRPIALYTIMSLFLQIRHKTNIRIHMVKMSHGKKYSIAKKPWKKRPGGGGKNVPCDRFILQFILLYFTETNERKPKCISRGIKEERHDSSKVWRFGSPTQGSAIVSRPEMWNVHEATINNDPCNNACEGWNTKFFHLRTERRYIQMQQRLRNMCLAYGRGEYDTHTNIRLNYDGREGTCPLRRVTIFCSSRYNFLLVA